MSTAPLAQCHSESVDAEAETEDFMKLGRARGDLAVAALDASQSQICVVDTKGTIIGVNAAWEKFGQENSEDRSRNDIGVNYLHVCQQSEGPASEESRDFVTGLRDVLEGKLECFQLEYPCHAPKENRWFLGRISPLRLQSHAGRSRFVGALISHVNITNQKLVELEYARLASTDPLTGVPNRRFFEKVAEMEISRFHRFGVPLALLIVDLDNFKAINDTYGHLGGDEALRRVASEGAAVFRVCDLFARLGGEEFVCLLTGTDQTGACSAAERLRVVIEQLPVTIEGRHISVTASIGVAVINQGDHTIERAMLRADEALYAAKAAGRNCVRIGPCD
jgi:diguanylate cyclase (GGDEF)-like protein